MKCEEEVLGVNVRIGVWVSSELIARYYLCLVGIAGIICVFLRIAILFLFFEDWQVFYFMLFLRIARYYLGLVRKFYEGY